GIGRALALRLAAEGARLAVSDVDAAAAARTAEECGANARGYRLDVADRAAFTAHAEAVLTEFGQVNLVFNNAGVALTGNVTEMSWADFDWIVGVNLGGVLNGSKIFLPHLIASGDGHLVNISSVFGFIGVPTQSAYCATKFAVRGFTESLRQEMKTAKAPVGVSCVHPGGIKTNIARSMRASGDRDARSLSSRFDRIARTTPDSAARTILGGVRRDSARILIGPDAYLLDGMPRVLGSRYQEVVSRAASIGGL
ncbi:MAG: SDR family NAD(P)-dependent oxidoreductase, partial [Sciscionella sp.]